MLREIILLLSITLLLFCLSIIKQSEGFANPPKFRNQFPQWAKLSDDQAIELFLVNVGIINSPNLVDPSLDSDAAKVLGTIQSLTTMHSPKEYKNQSDIDGFKNTIINKASENKNLSVAFSIFKSHLKAAIKLAKRAIAVEEKQDHNLNMVIFDDAKALAKRSVQEIREKIPNFPFNPDLKTMIPEAFVETPKPTASECKRFFKCSSIYAA
jgi:hypothetical protein